MTANVTMADPAAEYRALKTEIDDAVHRVLASGRYVLGPDVAIGIGAVIKKPGECLAGQPVELSVVRQDASADMSAYERLLGDAMNGDATLFARQDGVEAAWVIVDPLIARTDVTPIEYEPGSWGPKEADRLVEAIGGWNLHETR